MRTVVRDSFARHTIRAERIYVTHSPGFHKHCDNCGGTRETKRGRLWLYRFHVDDDQGARNSGPIANGKLFCSRECCESYTGRPFDETAGGR